MGGYFSSGQEEKTPIGLTERLVHVFKNYWRGFFGFILGAACIPPFNAEPGTPLLQARGIYLMLIVYFIFQPVSPPITGIMPVFLIPVCNIVNSKRLCLLFFNDETCHFILGSMMLLLLNNSGFDRRLLVYFLCIGKKFSPIRFLLFISLGAYLASMLSNRLIVMNTLMEIVTPTLDDFADETTSSGPNNALMRKIIICCIGCACSIGSTVSIHSSTTIMLFRAIWHGGWTSIQFPDTFNYFQYGFFIIPLSITLLLANVAFFCLVLRMAVLESEDVGGETEPNQQRKFSFGRQPLPEDTCTSMKNAFLAHKDKLPEMSHHEMQSVFFTVLYLLMLVSRYSYTLGGGWSSFRIVKLTQDLPYIRDCTVSAIFVVLLCILPKDWYFMRALTAKTKSEMPPPKRPSAILFWKFVDMNVNYGYIFLFGCGLCLDVALQQTRYNQELANYYGSTLKSLGFELSLLIFLALAAVFANLTIGGASVIIMVPFVKAMGSVIHTHPWPSKCYLGALGVGICASFGHMSSFKYTPNYYAKVVGKVKTLDMMKLGIGPLIIDVIITWFFLMVYAPTVFDPSDEGIYAIAVIPPPAIPSG